MIDYEKIRSQLDLMESELLIGISDMDDDEQFPCVIAMRLAIERIDNIRGMIE